MTWAIVALLSSACFALVSVADKRLLSWHMPSVKSYYLWLGTSVIIFALVVLLFSGIPNDVKVNQLIVAYISGLSWGLGLVCLFQALKEEEVSRAVAIYHSFPVFVAIFAVIFLDESLNLGQWLSIMVVVIGAILISLHNLSIRALVSAYHALPLLIMASFMTALGHFASKAALDDLPVNSVYVFRNLGMGTLLMLFARPSVIKESLSVFKDRTTVMFLFIVLVILVPTSVVLTLFAISLGQVSLVATLMATRPFFVFIYSVILSSHPIRLLNEPLRKGTLTLKLLSIVLIVGGIIALGLL